MTYHHNVDFVHWKPGTYQLVKVLPPYLNLINTVLRILVLPDGKAFWLEGGDKFMEPVKLEFNQNTQINSFWIKER